MLNRSNVKCAIFSLLLSALIPGAATAQAAGNAEGVRGRLVHWNEVAMNATGLDHTPVTVGEGRVYGEQLGPTRASRAMAIVHVAIFEAVNAIERRSKSYAGLPAAPGGTSMSAAIAAAAHDTLVALYPSQSPGLDAALAADLLHVRDGRAKANGIALGKTAAAAVLALRDDDGSQRPEPRVGIDFITSPAPGRWRQDPISRHPLAL
jgi:hypothetical protein